MLTWSSKVLQRMSPLGWIAGGVGLALSFPAVRKRLRSVAVMTTAGIMAAVDNIKEIVNDAKNEMSAQILDTQDAVINPENVDSELLDAEQINTKTAGI